MLIRAKPFRMVLLLIAGYIACAASFLAAPRVHAQVNVIKASEADIKRAIEKAQQYLLKQMKNEDDPTSALVVVALLKSGLTVQNSEINAVVERLARNVSGSNYNPVKHHTYEAGVTLLALANADPRKYRSQVHAIARYIVNGQGKHGQWHYPYDETGDTSITQYAMLGLWEAARMGIPIPVETWDRSARWHLMTQRTRGGFAYHAVPRGAKEPAFEDHGTLHSMTVAGIGSLRIARRYLFSDAKTKVIDEPGQPQTSVAASAPKRNRSGKRFGILEPINHEASVDESGLPIGSGEPITAKSSNYTPRVTLAELDAGVDKGVQWMTANFTVSKPTGYPIYYLYGLERASALMEKKAYGDHDWYEEGAAHLVATQGADGQWLDVSGLTTGTAFGLLFLTKATAKMVEPEIPRVEFGSGILVGGRGLPEDLKASSVNDGKIKPKVQKKADLEELLAQLENPQIPLVEATQAEIVEQVVIGDRKKLIGQIDRLKKLAKHPDAEVRRTALWALGRSDDLRLAPILIAALQDKNMDVFVEARNALRCLSRRVEEFGPQEAPLDDASRERERQKWLAWYKQIRQYNERDLLSEASE